MRQWIVPLVATAVLLLRTPAARADDDAAAPALLPQPAELKLTVGRFTLDERTAIDAPSAPGEASYLADALAKATGFHPAVTPAADRTADVIRLRLVPARPDLGDEGYALSVRPDGVLIEAAKPAGIFDGVQTLRQLLPTAAPWTIPCVEIHDQPRLAWRGLMLDVSRHFFDTAEVEAVLEQMAQLKLNVFHWHLTDDNGWRIEIKRYPKLTTAGAWHAMTPAERDSKHVQGGLYGGFYTQEQIREVVAFAAVRHITVVPEVDAPAHCSAAMAAYPELAPDNGWTPVVATGQKGTTERCGAMCVAKPATVAFCHGVIDELLPLFPSPYLHIGGDEVFYDQWQACPISRAAMAKLGCRDMADLQVRFTNDLVAYVEAKGRHAIIWNNLYRQTVDKRAVNQFWRDMNPARDFANAGYTVLVSDSSHYYFDHHPALRRVYANDPLKMPKAGLSAEAVGRVPGIEACAWTEHIADVPTLQQQMYPLLFADAEAGWTPMRAKDWDSFERRVVAEQARLFGGSGQKD
jgi:hexosaminidase